MDKKNRVFGLDILRAAAILIVLFNHSYLYSHIPFFSFLYQTLPDGVGLFFVLSGFLIGGILLKTIHKDSFSFKALRTFWVRRWLRTLPAYFLVITALFVFMFLLHQEKSISEHLKYYFFVQSVTDGTAGLYEESWSLCIEEWFYLLIPFALFISMYFLSISKKKIILFWIFFVIITITAIRVYRAQFIHNSADWDTFLRRALVTRIDSIMYGFLGAYLYYYSHPIWEKKNTLFIIGITLIVASSWYSFVFEFGFYLKYIYFTVQGLFTLFLLPKLCSIKSGTGKIATAITFISTISYSMYLLNRTPFHEFIIRILRVIGLPDDRFVIYDWTRYLAFMLWSFGGAYLLYKYVETPALKFRNKVAKD